IRNCSVPLMLSAEEDVNGQHAVSAGRLDKSKLFYLMSRGLDEKEAQKLVVGALFATVLERVPDAELSEEISREVEERIEHGQR
ncbi:MAG: SufD family Fe-S cluster assembly protein, partial [Acidaminococcaceae bacterium]|nr:SufD family Fe-S cluster assembly protein [Acidaminococcaceae bacterium]